MQIGFFNDEMGFQHINKLLPCVALTYRIVGTVVETNNLVNIFFKKNAFSTSPLQPPPQLPQRPPKPT